VAVRGDCVLDCRIEHLLFGAGNSQRTILLARMIAALLAWSRATANSLLLTCFPIFLAAP
jgi:hypothetical protein